MTCRRASFAVCSSHGPRRKFGTRSGPSPGEDLSASAFELFLGRAYSPHLVGVVWENQLLPQMWAEFGKGSE
jgi:hypothetical protein